MAGFGSLHAWGAGTTGVTRLHGDPAALMAGRYPYYLINDPKPLDCASQGRRGPPSWTLNRIKPRKAGDMSDTGPSSRSESIALTRKISAAMITLYSEVYGHHRTTASTYINGDVVVCILENILSSSEQELVAAGGAGEVLEGRVAFQTDRQDEFSAAVERLTRRRVVAFLSGNQVSPGIACELFFLEPVEAAVSPS
jgi:uncharacterized protein YbcI